jgi:hypothetical protein
MQHYVGLDVSVKETSVCIVDKAGKVIREVKVATKPAEILAVLTEEALAIERICGVSSAKSCGGNAARKRLDRPRSSCRGGLPYGIRRPSCVTTATRVHQVRRKVPPNIPDY